MAYDHRFTGTYRFADADTLAEALEDARAGLEGEDEDYVDLIEEAWDDWFTVDGDTLRIDIELHGPGELWFILEAIVETLADAADAGRVEGTQDDDEEDVTVYPAAGEDDLGDEEDEDD